MSNEELAAAIKAGDKALIIKLWEQCKGYIVSYGKHWYNAFNTRADVELDDFIQSGYIALVNAMDYFNADLTLSFIGVLKMFLKTAFSEFLGIRTERQRKDPLNNYASLDKPLGDEFDGETIADTIAVEDEALTAIEENSFKAELYKLLHEAVDSLPAQKQEAINKYYFANKPYKAIADGLNISVSRVGDIIYSGLNTIRTSAKGKAMKEMYAPERNYYRNTGLTSFFQSGMSSPERELIYKEIAKRWLI